MGIKVDKYYASEIKPHAIEVTQHNYPNTIQLGDVTKIETKNLSPIDLLIGGSPCQDLSQAHRERLGLKGSKSSLFFEYIRILNECKPKYFLLENVKMTKENQDIISKYLKVQPIRINSKLVSAQLRDRFYWTNIPNVTQPEDKHIFLKDIITSGYTNRDKARAILESESRPLTSQDKMFRRYDLTGFTTIIFENEDLDWRKGIRYLNQIELKRLQTLPEGYTKILNRNKAAGLIGDAWTVDVVSHILKNLIR